MPHARSSTRHAPSSQEQPCRSAQLVEPALGHRGRPTSLPARIHRAVTQAAANSAGGVDFQVRGTFSRAARYQVEDQLLRVAQEAVNNAVRHASDSAIDVTLAYDTRAVEANG